MIAIVLIAAIIGFGGYAAAPGGEEKICQVTKGEACKTKFPAVK